MSLFFRQAPFFFLKNMKYFDEHIFSGGSENYFSGGILGYLVIVNIFKLIELSITANVV